MSRSAFVDRRPRSARRWLLGIAVAQASLSMAGCPGTPASEGETDDTATGAVVEGSSRPWDEARARGVEFRAVGQEPGWSLELDQGRSIRYNGDYGQVQLTMPAPEPTRDSAGVVTYRVQTDSHELAVMIREEACQDVMSGEAFTHAVTIRLDGRELAGCGRTLSTGDVSGTFWRPTELDGSPAVPGVGTREPHIRLLADSSQGDTVTLEASGQPLARFTAAYLR